MIYIIVALKAEAQAFVDKYKLKNYKNDSIEVVISGMGASAMAIAVKDILRRYTDDDMIVNVGICGANKKYEIGELIDERFHHITCIDYEACDAKHEIVDMESGGFLDATKNIKDAYIFKVVSDHFEPKSVTKDMAKKVIFNQIDEIIKRVLDAKGSSDNGC